MLYRERCGCPELCADPEQAPRFRSDSAAALRESRLLAGWFDTPTGGAQPWQPALEGSRRFDDQLGPGFAALCCGGVEPGADLTTHALWQALAPRVIGCADLAGLDAGAFGGVIDPARPGITLLRPDRFVLAHLEPATATDTLDGLAAALGEA